MENLKEKICYDFEYHHDGVLVMINYCRDIYLKDILCSLNRIIKYSTPKLRGILIDMQQATLMLTVLDVKKIMKHAANANVIGEYRVAIITENPKHVAFAILAGRENDVFITAPFSTKKAATEWIMRGQGCNQISVAN